MRDAQDKNAGEFEPNEEDERNAKAEDPSDGGGSVWERFVVGVFARLKESYGSERTMTYQSYREEVAWIVSGKRSASASDCAFSFLRAALSSPELLGVLMVLLTALGALILTLLRIPYEIARGASVDTPLRGFLEAMFKIIDSNEGMGFGLSFLVYAMIVGIFCFWLYRFFSSKISYRLFSNKGFPDHYGIQHRCNQDNSRTHLCGKCLLPLLSGLSIIALVIIRPVTGTIGNQDGVMVLFGLVDCLYIWSCIGKRESRKAPDALLNYIARGSGLLVLEALVMVILFLRIQLPTIDTPRLIQALLSLYCTLCGVVQLIWLFFATAPLLNLFEMWYETRSSRKARGHRDDEEESGASRKAFRNWLHCAMKQSVVGAVLVASFTVFILCILLSLVTNPVHVVSAFFAITFAGCVALSHINQTV